MGFIYRTFLLLFLLLSSTSSFSYYDEIPNPQDVTLPQPEPQLPSAAVVAPLPEVAVDPYEASVVVDVTMDSAPVVAPLPVVEVDSYEGSVMGDVTTVRDHHPDPIEFEDDERGVDESLLERIIGLVRRSNSGRFRSKLFLRHFNNAANVDSYCADIEGSQVEHLRSLDRGFSQRLQNCYMNKSCFEADRSCEHIHQAQRLCRVGGLEGESICTEARTKCQTSCRLAQTRCHASEMQGTFFMSKLFQDARYNLNSCENPTLTRRTTSNGGTAFASATGDFGARPLQPGRAISRDEALAQIRNAVAQAPEVIASAVENFGERTAELFRGVGFGNSDPVRPSNGNWNNLASLTPQQRDAFSGRGQFQMDGAPPTAMRPQPRIERAGGGGAATTGPTAPVQPVPGPSNSGNGSAPLDPAVVAEGDNSRTPTPVRNNGYQVPISAMVAAGSGEVVITSGADEIALSGGSEVTGRGRDSGLVSNEYANGRAKTAGFSGETSELPSPDAAVNPQLVAAVDPAAIQDQEAAALAPQQRAPAAINTAAVNPDRPRSPEVDARTGEPVFAAEGFRRPFVSGGVSLPQGFRWSARLGAVVDSEGRPVSETSLTSGQHGTVTDTEMGQILRAIAARLAGTNVTEMVEAGEINHGTQSVFQSTSFEACFSYAVDSWNNVDTNLICSDGNQFL